MQLPSIQIRSTNAQIGVQSQRPHLHISRGHADITIRQEHAAIDIQTTPARLTINQREAFASANLKHVYRLNEEFAAKGRSNAAQVTAKYAREGDQMMRIENGSGGDIFAHLAKIDSILFTEKQATIAQMPRPFSVKTNYQPANLNIRFSGGNVTTNANPRETEISHRKWQTDVYLKQKQSISFQAVGINVNQQL
ncbi:hypothetical protein DS745_07800 [Anaerobacillus alkaliphilus]|uniref:Uncharacterized protein n=1 Tax=Anaerobacillus alkaliphilus TaxID=1548597 RepID=A0A4Q0VV33_9BACI|nr:DUF6470 family protein [Anaerobacillus alkaliphilus]RXJ02284.1 hypothetical protein DS745_07800 [Anaerobacillus alkaliphilus]